MEAHATIGTERGARRRHLWRHQVGAKFRAVGRTSVSQTPQWSMLAPEQQEAVKVVSLVLPFRTNRYVMDELIDWSDVPNDPMFQLTFPQRGMLPESDYDAIVPYVRSGDEKNPELRHIINRIHHRLNPHPAGQLSHNVPRVDGRPLPGVQHKYRETVLFFPKQGQTCHAYCTFCFRWPQFVGLPDAKFESREVEDLVQYLQANPQVSDVLITGGDPMIMKAENLRQYMEPLLRVEHIRNIRIGSKSIAYWPQRFVTDTDADDVLRVFEMVVDSGRHLALMAHFNHGVEMGTPIAEEAMRRIRSTGANIRMQAPLLNHINNDPVIWADMWCRGVRNGAIPYYMFVERDTGPKHYFEVPLVRAWQVFREAYRRVSGLCRSVRGPSMSAFPGKVRVVGVTKVADHKVLALEYLQCRDPELVGRPFFAKFNPEATWLDDLEPAFDSDRPFFEWYRSEEHLEGHLPRLETTKITVNRDHAVA